MQTEIIAFTWGKKKKKSADMIKLFKYDNNFCAWGLC